MQLKTQEFLGTYSENYFPEALLAAYIPMECLAQNEHCETYLLREKASGRAVVVKCYPKVKYDEGHNEGSILKALSHEGLPRFVGEYETEKTAFVLREYVEGIPLNEWIRDGERSSRQLLTVIMKLCDILAYLHGQNPPVIHRDLKPSNVIIDGQRVSLIDFGISRRWSSTSDTDTVYLGTKKFAPPEQFGYAQTDKRTDIFSFGVLLYYLFTGEIDVKPEQIPDRRLRRIIKKCTAFSPKGRYADISAVKRALGELIGIRRYKRAVIAGVFLAALLGTGSFVYNHQQGQQGQPPVHEDFLVQNSLTLSINDKAVPMTRGEAIKILVETLGVYDPAAESSYSDVPPDHPYYRYISSASQEKLVQGNTNGAFGVDDPASAGMYALLIMDRALGIYQVTVDDPTDYDAIYQAGAKAGNVYGIITDEQLSESNEDAYAPMTLIPGSAIIPKAQYGTWIEWDSSDEGVCTVDSGQITPVGPGTATVTASYNLGGVTVADTCLVTITE